MLDAVLDYAVTGGEVPLAFQENPDGSDLELSNGGSPPRRMEGNQLHRYSKVLESSGQLDSAQPQVSLTFFFKGFSYIYVRNPSNYCHLLLLKGSAPSSVSPTGVFNSKSIK